jgi:hypothetical protein
MNCQSPKTGIHQFGVGEGWDADASTPQKLRTLNGLASSHGDTTKGHQVVNVTVIGGTLSQQGAATQKDPLLS